MPAIPCLSPSCAAPAPDRKSTRLNSRHTEIYPLSLHAALPISLLRFVLPKAAPEPEQLTIVHAGDPLPVTFVRSARARSEEHTSELPSHRDLPSFPPRRSSDLSVALRSA